MLRHRTLARSKFLAAVGVDCLTASTSPRALPRTERLHKDGSVGSLMTALACSPPTEACDGR